MLRGVALCVCKKTRNGVGERNRIKRTNRIPLQPGHAAGCAGLLHSRDLECASHRSVAIGARSRAGGERDPTGLLLHRLRGRIRAEQLGRPGDQVALLGLAVDDKPDDPHPKRAAKGASSAPPVAPPPLAVHAPVPDRRVLVRRCGTTSASACRACSRPSL